ncbi:MAG: hypothetical protein ACODAU_08835 [Myxococcota bacterium]
MAYLRCEGLPIEEGPYPCPRDLELEQAGWEVLRGLEECPTAPARAGQADVRLHFGPEGPPEIRLLPAATDLDGPRLLSCVEGPLEALRTTLTPQDMVVSFRFRLVE